MVAQLKSARLANGINLPYAEHGDAFGTPVVLLHGITDSWRSFERVLPLLHNPIRAIALTQRGHGDADRPESAYCTRDFSNDVAAFLDALGIERAVVVGHSMGSSNAMRFAIDHPGRVRGLVLVAAFENYSKKPGFVDFVEKEIKPLADPIDPAVAREFQLSTLAKPIPADFLETAVQESLKIPARVWKAAFAGSLEDDFSGEIGKITAPTLILWGDRDAFCPRADQDALLAAIPGSRLIVYQGTGHALHWEEPERFAADLAKFVLSLGD